MKPLIANKIINNRVYIKMSFLNKIKKILKIFYEKVIKSFFCNSNDVFMPIYFWVTFLMLAITVDLYKKIFTNKFAVPDLLSCLSLVGGLLLFYKKSKK
jgi:hypothetical protein